MRCRVVWHKFGQVQGKMLTIFFFVAENVGKSFLEILRHFRHGYTASYPTAQQSLCTPRYNPLSSYV